MRGSQPNQRRSAPLKAAVLSMLVPIAAGAWLEAQASPAVDRLADRGPGLSTSLFGTYVERGELLVYPFYEYTKSGYFEYQPRELGYPGSEDYRGEFVEEEYLLFLAYGISDRLAVELEAAVYTKATFDKANDDPSALPAHLEESGLGDVETQLRWRWSEETEERPEMFSFVKIVFPLQKDKVLVGTSDWEGEVGFGVTRGYRWGTITARASVAWDGEDQRAELGEYAFEYLKRLSPSWRLVATFEGEGEDMVVVGEAQWHFAPWGFLKLNCGFGISEKAEDLAPEVGVLFRF
ncbi:MAG: hypothetical protein AAB011_03780 [Candidatus Eisenbacteria bacterium]